MKGLNFSLPASGDRVEVTRELGDVTFIATVRRSLSHVAEGLLHGICDLDPSQLLDGASIWSEACVYWLKLTAPNSYRVMGPDFAYPAEFMTKHTEDLTLPLWMGQQQSAVAHASGMPPAPVQVDQQVLVQRSVVTMLEQGLDGTITLQRHQVPADKLQTDEGVVRTGWHLKNPAAQGDDAAMVTAYVGSLLGLMPEAAPFLSLPAGALLRFHNVALSGAWILDQQRAAELAKRRPDISAGQAILKGLVADPILSEVFVEADLAAVPDERRPAPEQNENILRVVASLLDLPLDSVSDHGEAIPEVGVLRYRNQNTGKALIVGSDGSMLLGDDRDVLVSRYLRGGRLRIPVPGSNVT